jgi:uncharacterized protein (DUF302 family)
MAGTLPAPYNHRLRNPVNTRAIGVERVTILSSKTFPDVAKALEQLVGRPDMGAFTKEISAARTAAELERVVHQATGASGLMLFMRFDLGEILRKAQGPAARGSLRYLIGNPLIMKEMVKHVPDAGSYAPITILVDERSDGVHLSYDRMASFLAPYDNSEALKVARDLDKKVETVLSQAAG